MKGKIQDTALLIPTGLKIEACRNRIVNNFRPVVNYFKILNNMLIPNIKYI